MTKLKDLHRRWSKEAKYKATYGALHEEFELARALIEARAHAGLTQTQLARRMKTSQSYVARVSAEIWASELPDRRRGSSEYFAFSVVGFATVCLLVWGLTSLGNRIARQKWLPEVVALQRDLFERTRFVTEHQGWPQEQWDARDRMPAEEALRFRTQNLKDAERSLGQMEKL